MTYLWINPVSERMISENSLKTLLEAHKLVQVRCCEDWVSIVRQKYAALMAYTAGTVADARCPAAVDLVREIEPQIQVADIEPILFHCAREISSRLDLSDGSKIITTPCRILAERGNELGLKDTRFVSWKDFLAELGEKLEPAPSASPIPPGFFAGLPFPVVSLSGQEEIAGYMRDHCGKEEQKLKRLMELLYCSQGCHVGDGVR